MKKIMILGASILQLPAILKAKEMGLYVIAVDMDPNAIGLKHADESLIISTIDINNVRKAAKERKIDGIFTLATDMPVRTIAAVAEEMHLVGISMNTAAWATDKTKMRIQLAKYSVPIPSFYIIQKKDEYYNAIKKFKSEFIVKPADNSGSRGIFLVRDDVEVEKAYDYAMGYSRNGLILVEEFMQGQEVSVETLSYKKEVSVIAITDKLTNNAPYFVEMGHSQPTQHDFKMTEEIKEIAIKAVKALQIENGPSHTEIIVTNEGPKIVEIGARLGGDCITTHLVPYSTGVDMLENCIKISLNEEPDLESKYHKASAIRYIKTHPGYIKSISGINDAFSIEGVKEIYFVKTEGEYVKEIKNSTDRIGFVIAQCSTAEKAIHCCEKAISKINIEIETVIN